MSLKKQLGSGMIDRKKKKQKHVSESMEVENLANQGCTELGASKCLRLYSKQLQLNKEETKQKLLEFLNKNRVNST
jgi:hypothetical protein